MKALVLSGGGALGAFEAGAIQALTDGGEEFDLVCGTSIGAINASSLAARAKANEITVIMLQPPQSKLPNYVMQQTLLLQNMLSVNEDPNVSVKYVAPGAQLPVSVLGFSDQKGINRAFDAGVEAGKKAAALAKS